MNLYLDTSLEIRENYTAFHLSRDEVTGNPTDSIFLVNGIKYLFKDEYPIYLFLTKTHLIKDSYIQIKALNIISNWKLLLRIIKSTPITISSRVISPHHILKKVNK